jgi:hypothetical protein
LIQNGNSIDNNMLIAGRHPKGFAMNKDESEQESLQIVALFCGIGMLLSLWAIELDSYSAVDWF